MNDSLRSAADVGLTAISLGTAWARIEAGWHYPSDTLVGMAIGNFLASFFNEAFLRSDEPATGSLAITAADGGAVLMWQAAF
jgi:membrane-associated phospholipid phosphatase